MREMKNSGIAWIGEIPKEWEVAKLGTLYTNRNEKVSDKDYAPLSVTMKGILPQLETAAKTDDGDNRKLVRKGDFAINSRSDRRGSCGISPYDGSVSLINTILCPRGEMNPSFYNWLFHTTLFADEFYKWGHGIVDDLWTTRWQEMKNINIVVPALEEQRLIADFLDEKCGEIDELVALQEKMIDELKAYKQSVITETVTKGLNPNVKMKDSGVDWIGEIPEHWSLSNLKFLINILSGYAFSSTDFAQEGIPLLRGINVAPDGIRWEDVVYWNKELSKSLQPFLLKEGDIVLGLDRPWISAGTRLAIIKEQDCPSLLLQRVCRIRVESMSDFKFIYYSLICDRFQKTLNTDTTGISVPHISTEQVNNYKISYPPLSEQHQIATYLDAKCSEIDSLIAIKQKKIEELKDYKKSLIYEYVTGKKQVR